MAAFNCVVFSVWYELVRHPFLLPRVSRLPHISGSILLACVATALPGAALAGKAFHAPAFALSLVKPGTPATQFHGSARSIAPFLHTPDDKWYHHLGHSAAQPERVATLDKRLAPEPRVARLNDQTAEQQAVEKTPAPGLAALPPAKASAATVLAFAPSSPKAEGGAIAALRTMSEDAEGGIDLGALEIENVPLPEARPQRDEAVAKPEAPAAKLVPAPKAVASLPPPEKPTVAEKPTGGLFKNLFNGSAKRGNNKIAVYDISAAKVYMPDGSVLEAHSGIGKMADNPRYVHVKMNGPTPPQTYDLRMRERRFHGVEAVRMLPVGDQTMHGRDGILTHSYLLRGRAGQSHGCVAFKEYHKFLAAFKKGHVTRIIVVPGGGAGAFARANSRAGDDA